MRIIILFVVTLMLVVPTVDVLAAPCSTFAAPVAVGQINNPAFAGISGLAASRYNPGVWWIHNDGGSGSSEAGKFYAISSAGKVLGSWSLAGVARLEEQGKGTVDVEDVAVGPGPADGTYLYLADTGGNRYGPSGRSSVRIFRQREPRVDFAASTPTSAVLTDYTTWTLAYPSGERYDAETLMIDTNGDIFVVTKDGNEGISHVFSVPPLPDGQTSATLKRVATLRFGLGALTGGGLAATSGDISSRGNEAIIRTYNRVFRWQKAAGTSWADTFTHTAPCMLPAAPPQSYEAVAFDRMGIDVFDTHESKDGKAAIQRYARTKATQLPLISR